MYPRNALGDNLALRSAILFYDNILYSVIDIVADGETKIDRNEVHKVVKNWWEGRWYLQISGNTENTDLVITFVSILPLFKGIP